MAQKSQSYDPQAYGRKFSIMPAGNHQMKIARGLETRSSSGSPQWLLELQPLDPRWKQKDERPYKLWLHEDGVVEALFDAAGIDPATVQACRDYRPEQFETKTVTVEIYHNTLDSGKVFANVRRLVPVFTTKNTPAPAPAPVDDVPWGEAADKL